MLALAAVLAGALTGVLGALFRLALDAAGSARDAVLAWSHRWPSLGWLVPVLGAAVAAAIARALVRFAPLAAGSGVQHVEAVTRGQSEPAGFATVPVKFAGGVLAIGSGLALGREGPSVQMGAVLGHEVSRRLRLPARDQVLLLTAAAGAGLGVAFNAPTGGAMFVFEEVWRAFRMRLGVATLLASAVAISVSRIILGDHPVFDVAASRPPSIAHLALFVALGVLLGALGAAYNRFVVWNIELLGRLRRVPVEGRAALVGGLVGLAAWFTPSLVGGGEHLNERILAGPVPVTTLAIILAARWVLGPISYAPGTPGGLFAPLLLVGAAAGALYQGLLEPLLGSSLPGGPAFAAVGMAALFAACIRAPFTGVLLAVEMTASTAMLLPTLAACAAASGVASILRNPPIYDTLRWRMLESAGSPAGVLSDPTRTLRDEPHPDRMRSP